MRKQRNTSLLAPLTPERDEYGNNLTVNSLLSKPLKQDEEAALRLRIAYLERTVGRLKAALVTCGGIPVLKPTQTKVPFRKGGKW